MHYGTAETVEWLKPTQGQLQDSGWRPNGKRLNRIRTQPWNVRFCRKLVGWCIMHILIKVNNDWRDRRPQVAMQRDLPRFLVLINVN